MSEEEKVTINWMDLPVVPNPDLEPKTATFFIDRIECHPDCVDMVLEGLKGFKGLMGVSDEDNSSS